MKFGLRDNIRNASLIIFGFFLFFIILEAGLRLSGFILLSIQENRNKQNMEHKGVYRIMCLGESTTAGQYPYILEEILNKRNVGTKFSVIDKGVPGTSTTAILNELESNIDKYRPNMIIAMMGINDSEGRIPYEPPASSKAIVFLKSFRSYKLARLIWLHILNKTRVASGTNRLPSGNLPAYLSIPTEDSLKKTIESNPKSYGAYIELGRLYLKQNKFLQAEESFKKAIKLNPENDNTYVVLGWAQLNQNKFSEAECAFKKAIELNPQNYDAYFELGCTYLNQNKFSEAECAFKKAIELNPNEDRAYGAITLLYKKIGKLELAGEYTEKLNKLRLMYYDPITVNNYLKLKEILDKKTIKLVCVQYPMCSLQPLKKIFEGDEKGIIFIDNDGVFRQAVNEYGFSVYFKDMFGGNFGHCTRKGNELLAKNIANEILKKVPGGLTRESYP